MVGPRALVARVRDRFAARKDAVVVARLVETWKAARPLPHPYDYAKFADEGYRRSAMIYACVREIATSAAEAQVRVGTRSREGTLEPVAETHPLLRLLEQPNPEQSSFEFFEVLVTQLEVCGNAYVHKVRNRLGSAVVELWLLRPDRIKIKVSADGMVERYDYTVGTKPVPLPAEDVIHVQLPDVLEDFYGLSPVAVAARYADLDDNGVDFLRAFFENHGMPAGILKLKGTTEKKERERIQELWRERYGGQAGWHTLAVLDADADYTAVGATPEKLRLNAVWGQTETRICMVFGVPPILVGSQTGLETATYANYESARRSLWGETLCPLYRRTGDALGRGLRDDFGSPKGAPLVVYFDFGAVAVLQEGVDAVHARALNAWKGGLITRNEGRKAIGHDEVTGGDVFAEEVSPLAFGAPPPEEQRRLPRREKQALLFAPADPSEPAPETHAVADRHVRAVLRQFEAAVKAIREGVDLDALARACEARSESQAAEACQLSKLEAELAPLVSELGAAMVESGAKALEPLKQAVRASGNGAAERLREGGLDLAFDAQNPRAVRWLAENGARLVREVDRSTRETIAEIIARGFDDGSPPVEMAREIRDIGIGLTSRQMESVRSFRERLEDDGVAAETVAKRAARYAKAQLHRRAETIARTETIGASAGGQQEAWEAAADAGLIDATETKREWIATDDDRLDPVCEQLDGEQVGLTEQFSAGVMHPPQHPNCRCTVGLVTE